MITADATFETVRLSLPEPTPATPTSTDLTRQPSAASTASNASSHLQTQRYRRIRRFIEAIFRKVERVEAKISQRLQKSHFNGWRMGVLLGSCMSAFVLCCNVILVMIGATVTSNYKNGISDLVYGGSKTISSWSIVFHLLINVFSTILLAASNYTMQVLSSPTRADLDRAHANGDWLDIGLLSWRNLRRIPRGRMVLWLLLASSSIPLHLL